MKIDFGAIGGGVHRFPVHVFYNATDVGRVVYYANYLRFAEEARGAMFELLAPNVGGSVEGFVVRSCNTDYLKSAVYGDDLVVETSVLEVSKVYIVLRQRVMRGEELLVNMDVKLVYVSFEAMGRPQRLPEFWKEKLEGLGV